MPATDQDFQAFAQWASKNNAYVHPALTFSPSTASVRTTSPIPNDSQLLKCPHHMTIDYAKACAAFPGVSKEAVAPHALLCFFLCKEQLKGENSFWWPYLKVLPETFDTPLYFDEEDKKFLEGCNLGEGDIEGRRLAWRKEFEEGIVVLGSAVEGVNWDRYLWARTVFTSRSFPGSLMQWGDAGDIPCNPENYPVLFPVVDSLNHKPMTKINWAPSSTALSLITDEDIPPDVECFNNYGPKGNEELLMGYGFCLDPNPTDSVALRFSPPLTTLQQEIRKHQHTESPAGIFYLRTSHLFDDSLLSLFRLLAVSPAELPYLQAHPTTPYISPRNEIVAHSHLLLALKAKLMNLESNPGIPKNSKQQSAKIYRDGQIAILRAAEKQCVGTITSTLGKSHTVSFADALACTQFAEAVEACFGSSDQEELEEADQEDVIFVLYLCWMYISTEDKRWRAWFETLEKGYGKPGEKEFDEEGGVGDVFEAVFPEAGEVAPGVFCGKGWTVELLGWGMEVFKEEGVNTAVDDAWWFGFCLNPMGEGPRV